MLAETMAAIFRKRNDECFTCGDKNHLKRDCSKKANKKPPRICPRCHRGMQWAKDCKSKFDIKRKPIPRNSSKKLLEGHPPPGLLQQKPGANSIFSFKPSTDIPALNDFFLYPQAVPSRVPTGLFGPLPPQTFSLLLG